MSAGRPVSPPVQTPGTYPRLTGRAGFPPGTDPAVPSTPEDMKFPPSEHIPQHRSSLQTQLCLVMPVCSHLDTLVKEISETQAESQERGCKLMRGASVNAIAQVVHGETGGAGLI